MAFPKISEVRQLSDEEIAQEIVRLKQRLFELRLEKATGRLEKPHEIKHAKHRLAQLMTVEHERKQQTSTQSEEASEPSQTSAT